MHACPSPSHRITSRRRVRGCVQEALRACLEKLRYEDIDEGVKATIDVFMAAALALVAEKALEAYVHPIIPVRARSAVRGGGAGVNARAPRADRC